MKILRIFLLLFFSAKAAVAQEKPLIASSINPIYQIILAVTADKSNNVLIVSPNVSDHDYSVKKNDVVVVQKADLIFYVSDDLEKNFAKLVISQKKRSHAFELANISGLRLLQKRNDLKKTDLHVWLNPQNAVKIAEFIAKKIAEIDPKNSGQYYKNLEKFKNDVVVTEKLVKSKMAKNKASDYIFFHDGYQYFENYFGLSPLKIVASGHDNDLSIQDLKEIDLMMKQGGVKCIIGERWDAKSAAQKLAKNYGIKFVKPDVSGGKSYSELLLQITDVIASCG